MKYVVLLDGIGQQRITTSAANLESCKKGPRRADLWVTGGARLGGEVLSEGGDILDLVVAASLPTQMPFKQSDRAQNAWLTIHEAARAHRASVAKTFAAISAVSVSWQRAANAEMIRRIKSQTDQHAAKGEDAGFLARVISLGNGERMRVALKPNVLRRLQESGAKGVELNGRIVKIHEWDAKRRAYLVYDAAPTPVSRGLYLIPRSRLAVCDESSQELRAKDAWMRSVAWTPPPDEQRLQTRAAILQLLIKSL